jgi:hypothetical protein
MGNWKQSKRVMSKIWGCSTGMLRDFVAYITITLPTGEKPASHFGI